MLIYLAMIDSEADRSKFETLYLEYKNLMLYTAGRILRDSRDTEDVVHQAFLKIIAIIDKIDAVPCPKTKSLFVTITERIAIDVYRARKRRSTVPLEEDGVNVPAASQIEHLGEQDMLAQAIALLPTRYREVLLLKYDNGFSASEIAALLDMTEANVRKTIQRAKGKLADQLSAMEGQINEDNR